MTCEEFIKILQGISFPHQESIFSLKNHYGITKSFYYCWDIIELKDSGKLLPQQVNSFWFNPDKQSDLLPPNSVSAFVSFGTDARQNHQKTLDYLENIFGKAKATSASNTLAHAWQFETAALEIITWPPELNQELNNPSRDRHPEMKSYCQLRLSTGYWVPLNALEKEKLKGITPFLPDAKDINPVIGIFDPLWRTSDRGLYRLLPTEMHSEKNILGRSADSTCLVGVEKDRGFILPKKDITGVQLDHILPGRFRGSSDLHIKYTDLHSSDRRELTKVIFSGATIPCLDPLAIEVAKWAGQDLVTTEYQDY